MINKILTKLNDENNKSFIARFWRWGWSILDNNPLLKQLFFFALIGGTSFILDWLILFALTDGLKINYLISTLAAFILSNIYNYIGNMSLVFKGRDDRSRQKEIAIYFTLAFMGLCWTELLMWVFVSKCNIHHLLAKVFTAAIVMFWNFITRKIFIEKKEK